MKREQIANHSRAAFYLKSRGRWAIPASRAWMESLAAVDSYQARQASSLLNRATAYRGLAHDPRYVGTWQPNKPRHFYAESPDSVFRNVTPVDSILTGYHGGYYDNLHGESCRDGDGLVWGIVAQLTGRNGKARFVPGYCYGSSDGGGATFDLGDIHDASGGDSESAQRDAAYTADSMAEQAAESARDYQSAWGAGSLWADLGEQIATARTNCLAVLAERKAFRGKQAPALCRAITDSVAAWRNDIAEARQERESLASGGADYHQFYWSEHDTTNLEAFAEGAGLSLAEAKDVCS